jgi:hypothetical protein
MKRVFLLGFICACSNGTSPSDGGTSDVVTQDVTTGDATPPDAPASDASDGGATTVPEQLDQAGKLALWLEAASSEITLGDGGVVTTWKDKSKNKNDATASGTNPSVEASIIAGHDAVHFSAITDALSIADAASLRFATDQVHIVAVTKLLTLRSFFFSKSQASDGGGNVGLDFFIANGGSTDSSSFSLSPYASLDGIGDAVTWGSSNELADGKFHVVSYRRTDATHISVWLDDLAPKSATVAAVNSSATGQGVIVGPLNGPSAPNFSIAEELVLHDASGVVADADVTSVHAYLKQKYGL